MKERKVLEMKRAFPYQDEKGNKQYYYTRRVL